MIRSLVVILILAVALPGFAADGTALFKAKCAPCHGENGAGDTAVGKNLKVKPLAAAEVQKLTDAELTKVISDGKGKMPPFGKRVTADEIKALVAHIRTFAKK